ncbi:hypothetical protein GALL_530320 [mine drainage metagenome]|uniref:Uncharacterized protein n=1 Tax=mine drainage metagenome TaxID=410659 RepID=A0A1J5PJF9_9ZZZZ
MLIAGVLQVAPLSSAMMQAVPVTLAVATAVADTVQMCGPDPPYGVQPVTRLAMLKVWGCWMMT